MEQADSSNETSPSFYARVLVYSVGICGGIVTGLGIFTMSFAEAGSYFNDDAAACMNCHVMSDHFDQWSRSSHSNVAVCNDCHAPEHIISKYLVKGINGYNHSLAFTTGNFEDNFSITKLNRNVAEQNCVRCHDALTHSINFDPEPISCLQCHSGVGH
ncbi:MAG: cytochrome c nitrite reductase small subunit [Candidatus Hydrogenedentota bacterium]|nr:MAG: cytochrome c nitrite reductase small subunit [Candidatus Hydrogenedentota bacterium]